MLHASLFGLVSMADVRGTPDAAHGELLRFFAEAAWYPTALLPSQGVQWEAVDNHAARATLRDGDTTATLLFRFNTDNLIDSVRAEARGGTHQRCECSNPVGMPLQEVRGTRRHAHSHRR